MHPYLFTIAGVKIASYGIFVALGYVAGVSYLRSRLKELEIPVESFWNLVTSIFIGAILGGKLLYVAVFWTGYGSGFQERIVNVIMDFRRGFIFYGGFLGGLIAGWWYARCHAVSFIKTADFAAPALALGHAIGRVGCFMAGCCHGRPASAPWAAAFTDPDCLVSAGYMYVPLHPVQLYESFGNLLLFVFLHYLLKNSLARKLKSGFVMLSYFAGYAVVRFIVEFYRGDERGGLILGLSQAQFISALSIVACLVIYKIISGRNAVTGRQPQGHRESRKAEESDRRQ